MKKDRTEGIRKTWGSRDAKKKIALKTLSTGMMIIALVFMLLKYPQNSIEAARNSLNIWWNNVFPVLLPFFILISMLIQSGFPALLAPALSPIMRIFKLPGETGSAVLLGAMSGYPSGAKMTASLLQDGIIDRNSAERLLVFCNLPSPMYMIGTVASALLAHPELGMVMIFSQYLSAILLSFAWARIAKAETTVRNTERSKHENVGMTKALIKAVSDGVISMLSVAGFMVFAAVIFTILDRTGVVNAIANSMGLFMDRETARAVIEGIFEMSSGCAAVSDLEISTEVAAALCCFVTGFGGLSILCQTLSFVQIRAHVILIAKLIRGSIAGVISYIMMSNMTLESSAFAREASMQTKSTTAIAICLIVLLFYCIIKKITSKT